VVLLEGVKKGRAPLVLEVFDPAGNKVFSTSLNLSLGGVEAMFRHKNLIQYGSLEAQPPDPEANPLWGEYDRLEEPVNCPDTECLGDNGKDFVFVHGYNVDGQQARGWQSETFKRMYWSGLRSRFWGVSWFGSKTQVLDKVTVNYHVNVERAINTVPQFRQFLNSLSGETTIAAHSLGNMLVSACLSDSNLDSDPNNKVTANIKNFILIDAAVALEAYINGSAEAYFTSKNPMVHPDWYNYKKDLAASEWYTLFPSDDHRSELTWRNRFENLPEGINYFNFYSSGEEVLDTHTGDPGLFDIATDGVGRYAWALQEKLKGRMDPGFGWILGSSYGGWGKNSEDYFEENTYIVTGKKVALPWFIANDLDLSGLKIRPFFDMNFSSELFQDGSGGSEYARLNRTKLLAKAFPSLTMPAGGPEGSVVYQIFTAKNMQTEFKNEKGDWPEVRKAKNDVDWKHSDLRNVGYVFIYNIFHELKKLSE
jgi:hypothetical protein